MGYSCCAQKYNRETENGWRAVFKGNNFFNCPKQTSVSHSRGQNVLNKMRRTTVWPWDCDFIIWNAGIGPLLPEGIWHIYIYIYIYKVYMYKLTLLYHCLHIIKFILFKFTVEWFLDLPNCVIITIMHFLERFHQIM